MILSNEYSNNIAIDTTPLGIPLKLMLTPGSIPLVTFCKSRVIRTLSFLLETIDFPLVYLLFAMASIQQQQQQNC